MAESAVNNQHSLIYFLNRSQQGTVPFIEIIFPDELERSEVTTQLQNEDSGIDIDDEEPLGSVLVDGFTIAGVVLNAFSLAVALIALKNQLGERAKTQNTPVEQIRIRRQFSSEIRTLPEGGVESVEKALLEITRSEGKNGHS